MKVPYDDLNFIVRTQKSAFLIAERDSEKKTIANGTRPNRTKYEI